MRSIDLDAEREYENSKIKSGGVRSDQSKFYWATRIPTQKHLRSTLEKIRNRAVLEIGCSSGENAKLYANQSSYFVGVDISDEAIRKASALGLKNAEFICTDGHCLPFENGSFDFVIVNSLLHHLDLKVSLKEIARVLNPNGQLIFREPLGTNPFFQAYRFLTPSARTKDERPFSFSDLKLIQNFFYLENTTWFGFLSIGSAFIRLNWVRAILTSIDNLLSHTPLRYFFWQLCGFARKLE